MRIAVLAMCLTLAACATPSVVTKVERVEVPRVVVQPCVAKKDIPPLPMPQFAPRDASIQRQAAGLAASYAELLWTAEYLHAILEGCAL